MHSDGSAARAADAVDATAFTVGRHIVFGAGHTVASDHGRLLGHELVHALQQGFADPPNHGLFVASAIGPEEAAARRLAGERDGGPPAAQSLHPVSRIAGGFSAPSVQREARPDRPSSGATAARKIQKPVKIEHKVPAAELQKHAAGAPARSKSTGRRPTQGPAPAPQQAPTPAPQQAPTQAPQQAPTPAPQQAPRTPTATQPTKPDPPSRKTPEPDKPTGTSSTATAQTSTEGSGLFAGGRGFGADLQFQPQGNLAARDRFNLTDPASPLTSPQWRGGLHPPAGDFLLPLNIILLDRELHIAGGKDVNVGFEPELIITPVGLSPHEGGWHYQPSIAAGLDLLHWKINEDLDWHIVQAQGFFEGDIPLAGKDNSLAGGGFQVGTGVERALPHAGQEDERFTVGANLTGQALWTSDGNFSYTIVGSIYLTWHMRHH